MGKTKTNVANNIKLRDTPNDVVYTPFRVIRNHLEYIKNDINEISETPIIYEPFSGDGRYVRKIKKHFPNSIIHDTEIQKGTDFFEFNEKIDCIITNPPYSILGKVFDKIIQLKPSYVSLLIGCINFTNNRIKLMNDNGYYLKSIYQLKIQNWFANSIIVNFSNKIDKNVIDFHHTYFKLKDEDSDDE